MKERKENKKVNKNYKAGGAIAALIIGAAVGSIATYVISQQRKHNEKSEKARKKK